MSLAAVLNIVQKMAQPTPQEVEAQAYAFRQLVQHLQNTADDAQNIDVMSVAGMCRNCVAKWLHRGLAYAGDGAASSTAARIDGVFTTRSTRSAKPSDCSMSSSCAASSSSCLLYTSPSPRDATLSRMPSSA